MDIVLCSDCGKVMKRYASQCERCTRTNLEYYENMDSTKLKVRVKQITGKADYASPIYSTLLVLAIAFSISFAAYTVAGKKKIAQNIGKHVTTAATAASVTH